jgi:hypothetical protein
MRTEAVEIIHEIRRAGSARLLGFQNLNDSILGARLLCGKRNLWLESRDRGQRDDSLQDGMKGGGGACQPQR